MLYLFGIEYGEARYDIYKKFKSSIKTGYNYYTFVCVVSAALVVSFT